MHLVILNLHSAAKYALPKSEQNICHIVTHFIGRCVSGEGRVHTCVTMYSHVHNTM